MTTMIDKNMVFNFCKKCKKCNKILFKRLVICEGKNCNILNGFPSEFTNKKFKK